MCWRYEVGFLFLDPVCFSWSSHPLFQAIFTIWYKSSNLAPYTNSFLSSEILWLCFSQTACNCIFLLPSVRSGKMYVLGRLVVMCNATSSSQGLVRSLFDNLVFALTKPMGNFWKLVYNNVHYCRFSTPKTCMLIAFIEPSCRLNVLGTVSFYKRLDSILIHFF